MCVKIDSISIVITDREPSTISTGAGISGTVLRLAMNSVADLSSISSGRGRCLLLCSPTMVTVY